ncbi:angiotensin-converting enzyme-like [Clytia hemisphaerica]|uniref:Angiotensin-converting enzyme n=1 Tax=Clytia hemisphaerica TaxID=252671 RepID=A0A7M5X2Y4_9CNID
MSSLLCGILLLFACHGNANGAPKCKYSDASDFLENYNKEANSLQKKDTLASWNYETNMNTANKIKQSKLSAKTSSFATKSRNEAKCLLDSTSDEDMTDSQKRQLKLITRTASSSDSEVNKKMSKLVSKMTAIYSETKIKKKIDKDPYEFKLNSHLLPIMSTVEPKNIGNLKWAWNVWRNAVGPPIKKLYTKFVDLANQGAVENGFADYGDYWRQEYEVNDLEKQIESILEEMNPLYKKLHAYTRYKLNRKLSEDVVKATGPLPAHLLNMWAQNWGHLYSILEPFPEETVPDVTNTMKKKKWKKKDVLKKAEEFFVSIGLESMPDTFYTKSLFKKEDGKKSVCHPSAWDIGDGDVRLKMPCMGVSQQDLITVSHEMGHAEYYLLYQDQPVEFRTGANPGFHEAVGDTIALSVMTPEHLKEIGLLSDYSDNAEEEINFLLKQALQKVAFIPFSYIIDKWRWSVFKGDTGPDDYNKYWWKLRKQYQGVAPPEKLKRRKGRSKELFDAGTFFHVAHNTEYLRYFLSHVLQFQFHKALCDEAGVSEDYHKCSIYKSKKAGEKLKEMLSLGKSLPWPDVLKVLTGSKTLSSKPIIAYFKPLEDWLDEHRRLNRYELGW